MGIKWTKSALKINYEGGPTHKLAQTLLGDHDLENFSEMEIYRVLSRIYSSGSLLFGDQNWRQFKMGPIFFADGNTSIFERSKLEPQFKMVPIFWLQKMNI